MMGPFPFEAPFNLMFVGWNESWPSMVATITKQVESFVLSSIIGVMDQIKGVVGQPKPATKGFAIRRLSIWSHSCHLGWPFCPRLEYISKSTLIEMGPFAFFYSKNPFLFHLLGHCPVPCCTCQKDLKEIVVSLRHKRHASRYSAVEFSSGRRFIKKKSSYCPVL